MTTTEPQSFTVGEVAEQTGLSVHALRFYEREGLMATPVRRLPNGHRAYAEIDVQWLSICTRLRASAMPLAQIRQLAELVRLGRGNEPERLALLQAHQDTVRARIHELEECLAVIDRKVAVYESHLADGTAAGLWAPQDDGVSG